MLKSQLERARRLWCSVPGVPRHTQAHNIRQWRRSVRALGTKWLLHPARAVQRETET